MFGYLPAGKAQVASKQASIWLVNVLELTAWFTSQLVGVREFVEIVMKSPVTKSVNSLPQVVRSRS